MPLLRRSRSRTGTVALVAAVAPVLLAPLVLGAVHAEPLVLAASLCSLALLLLGIERLLRRRPLVVSLWSLPLLVALVSTTIQLLPLPDWVRQVLSPSTTERVDFVTAALGAEFRALVRPVLSLDPPATAAAWLRLAGGLAIFLVVSSRARERRREEFVYRLLLGGAIALFMVAVGHRLAHVPKIWGVFGTSSAPLYAPLINPNHLARAFGACSLLCLGRALVVRSRMEATWFGTGAVACGLGVLLSLSRGGILAFGAASIGLAWLAFQARRRETTEFPFPRRHRVPELLAAAMMVLGLYVAHDALLRELGTLGSEDIGSSKAFLYPLSMRLLEDHWQVGVGNGAFRAVFPSVLEPGELIRYGTYSHVENGVVQALVDHGAPVWVLLLAAAGFVAVRLAQESVHTKVLGPTAAIFFLLVGDLFDFALETFFGFALLAFSLGLAAAHALREGERGVPIPPHVALSGSVMMLVGIGITAPMVWRENQRLLDDLVQQARGAERAPVVERALALHPSDAQYAYTLALERRRRRDPAGALAWANRALLLSPAHHGAHLEAARALFALGHEDQALLEYRLAWQGGGGNLHLLVEEVAKRTPALERRRIAVPREDAAALHAMCEVLVRESRLDEAQACVDEAATLPRATPALQRRSIELALRRRDVEGAEARVSMLVGEGLPDGPNAPLAAATTKLAQGVEAALVESEAWLKEAKEPTPLLHWRLAELTALGREAAVDDTLGMLEGHAKDHAGLDQVERARLAAFRRRGDLAEALRLARRLAARSPKDIVVWLDLAQLELSLGLVDAAEASHRRLQAVAPLHPRVEDLGKHLAGLRAAQEESRMRKLLEAIP